MEVSDNGGGMPPEAASRAATGFGLEMVYALVEQHNGTLEVDTDASGTGVTAVLEL
jgi:signal transduction histidine kinase